MRTPSRSHLAAERRYHNVFTTNHDLLLYRVVMHEGETTRKTEMPSRSAIITADLVRAMVERENGSDNGF